MIVTEYIPAEKLGQFHEILKATGGRYLSNPIRVSQDVLVNYAPGDFMAQSEAWKRCVTPIRETRRDQWWRAIMRRCGLPA